MKAARQNTEEAERRLLNLEATLTLVRDYSQCLLERNQEQS
jgi:hypothetical protein